ncbi:MAG: 30S ribosomal protein S4 [Candidatus Melainabacteria bacterium]|jgi:small subunit ribosomal protein S4|nr:30S ribosomal protein S4 [Cyanobacteria bacterium REEB446]MEB3314715.1 30S ribosomal protein S4 [Candidatus Melainabacteria bacterium]MEB3316284.1 30S ribosomal protein S4 [Candidatus Melainabacteria bacterium]
MARYTGPKNKLSRRYGQVLNGMPVFDIAKRPYRAGMHGQKRTKPSEYKILLEEKQKLRFSYGVILEKQFKRYVDKATKMKGPTGEILMQLLETRLDNIVMRMGFSSTIFGARQLVSHGHILVNSFKVDIPSYRLFPGDIITLKEKSRKIPAVEEAMKNWVDALSYIKRDKDSFDGELTEIPERKAIPVPVNEIMIVEYYSR